MTKQDRAKRTYESVLDAAATEFAAQGFAAANLTAMALRTGLTKGALYGHFPSKSALAEELNRRFTASWNSALRTAATSAAEPMVALRALALDLARSLEGDIRFRAGFRLAWETAQATTRGSSAIDDLHAQALDLVRRAQHDGDNPSDQKSVATLAVALVLGAYVGAQQPSISTLVATVRGMWEVALPADRPPGARSVPGHGPEVT